MLQITVAETATEQSWTLEGRLVGPWVGELRTRWKERHRAQNGRTCTVDLSAVTFIDKGGQRLLQIMSEEATQFIATSIYIKRVLDQLKPSGKRGLRKVIYCFIGALLGRVIAPLSRMQASRERTFLAPSAKRTPAVVGTRANPLGGKER
jgi:ABC-type transporter Mla MlaB component